MTKKSSEFGKSDGKLPRKTAETDHGTNRKAVGLGNLLALQTTPFEPDMLLALACMYCDLEGN
jgi:hypothetical protein